MPSYSSILRGSRGCANYFPDRSATETLPSRADRYIDKLGLADVDIKLQELQRRWGEYRPRKVVLHWLLILAPRKIQDYVVAHELVHFWHEEHSDAFWNVPDYETGKSGSG